MKGESSLPAEKKASGRFVPYLRRLEHIKRLGHGHLGKWESSRGILQYYRVILSILLELIVTSSKKRVSKFCALCYCKK